MYLKYNRGGGGHKWLVTPKYLPRGGGGPVTPPWIRACICRRHHYTANFDLGFDMEEDKTERFQKSVDESEKNRIIDINENGYFAYLGLNIENNY